MLDSYHNENMLNHLEEKPIFKNNCQNYKISLMVTTTTTTMCSNSIQRKGPQQVVYDFAKNNTSSKKENITKYKQIISFGTSCINCKISMGPNFDANQKSLCTFITFKLLEWTIFFFFKHFFLSNVHHSFNKIGEDLKIDN